MSEADSRPDVAIVAPDGSRTQLKLSGTVPDGAPGRLGELAEWRGAGRPRALIFRVRGPAGGGRLVVARLRQQPCVVAVVPMEPRQNEHARAIADGKLPPCL